MTMNERHIHDGMEVVGNDDRHIGRVVGLQDAMVQVSIDLPNDVFVPMDAIERVTGDKVMLNIPADQLEYQGWACTPVSKFDAGRPQDSGCMTPE